MIGHFILRLIIWFLLTANFGVANILIGVTIALVLPYPSSSPERLKDIVRALGMIVRAIPQSYAEAIELILHPHNQEEVVMERIRARRSPAQPMTSTPGLIFLDIFLITFTPKTLVLNYQRDGWYKVHQVRRQKQTKQPDDEG